MANELASIGDAGIKAAPSLENAVAAAFVADSAPGGLERNNAINAMWDHVKEAPSIKQFLFQCPLALFNA